MICCINPWCCTNKCTRSRTSVGRPLLYFTEDYRLKMSDRSNEVSLQLITCTVDLLLCLWLLKQIVNKMESIELLVVRRGGRQNDWLQSNCKLELETENFTSNLILPIPLSMELYQHFFLRVLQFSLEKYFVHKKINHIRFCLQRVRLQ